MKRAWRVALATLMLFLSTPAWCLALALVPIYYTERFSFWCVRRARFGFIAAIKDRPKIDPLTSRDRFLAKSRNARRHHKVVRS